MELKNLNSIDDLEIKDTQSLFLGRFQPLTKQHLKVFEYIYSHSLTTKHIFGIVEGKQSSKNKLKNPFTFDERKDLITKVLSNMDNFNMNKTDIKKFEQGYIPDIIEEIYQKDKILITKVYCGSDRERGYKRQLQQEGLDNLIDIEVIPRSNEDISQTKQRQYLFLDDKRKLKQLLPSIIMNDEKLYNFIQQRIYSIYVDVLQYGKKSQISKLLQELQKYTSLNQKQIMDYIINDGQNDLTETTLQEGITHLDDLKIDEFIEWVEKLLNENESIYQTEKYDGIQNISFEIQDGKLYQNRLSKGQSERKETLEDWGSSPFLNQLRSQHKFMLETYSNNKEIFDEYYPNGGQFEFEILPPLYGNVIRYENPNGKLIPLRRLDENITEEQFNNFQKQLDDLPQIKIKVPQYKTNPKDLKLQKYYSNEKWEFEKIREVNLTKLLKNRKDKIEIRLDELKDLLNTVPNENYPEITVMDQFILPLNKGKKEKRDQIKEIRQEYKDDLDELIKSFKTLLLTYINKEFEDIVGHDIEGIVLRDVLSNKQIKLVDKEMFTDLNQFYWKYINYISKGKTPDDKPILDYLEEGIIPHFWKNIISIFELNNIQNKKDRLDSKLKNNIIGQSFEKQVDNLLNYGNTLLSLFDEDDKYILSTIKEIKRKLDSLLFDVIKNLDVVKDKLITEYKNGKLKFKYKKYGDEKEQEMDEYWINRIEETINYNKYLFDTIKTNINDLYNMVVSDENFDDQLFPQIQLQTIVKLFYGDID